MPQRTDARKASNTRRSNSKARKRPNLKDSNAKNQRRPLTGKFQTPKSQIPKSSARDKRADSFGVWSFGFCDFIGMLFSFAFVGEARFIVV